VFDDQLFGDRAELDNFYRSLPEALFYKSLQNYRAGLKISTQNNTKTTFRPVYEIEFLLFSATLPTESHHTGFIVMRSRNMNRLATFSAKMLNRFTTILSDSLPAYPVMVKRRVPVRVKSAGKRMRSIR